MAKKQKHSSSSSSAAPSVVKKHASAQEFNPDYTNIIADLKKIGIMAVSFTAILVVLSFILN
jgi:hypothetical protein